MTTTSDATPPLAAPPCSAFVPRAGSLWLVVVECRYNVAAVCVSGKGFYIPGQEPCWHFSHVAEWIAEIDPANYQSATNLLPIIYRLVVCRTIKITDRRKSAQPKDKTSE